MNIFLVLLFFIEANPRVYGPHDPTPIDYFGQQPPGTTAQLFAPGLISTNQYEHSAPAFSPDGQLVLWTVVNKEYRASMLEMKYENGTWSAPHRPSFADSTADDYYPSFAPDGKKLYFSSRRKAPAGYAETADMSIWEVTRTSRGWGKPQPIDASASPGREYAHSVTDSGTLYFSSALDWNIHKVEKHRAGYAKPVRLPYSLNSVEYEDGPFIAPDESFLIFESQRPEGIDGSLDLYISFRNQAGQWSVPINMGPNVNSASAERFARLSPDGKYLFFGSNRNSSAERWGFDIYWIDATILDELRTDATAKAIIPQPLGNELITALSENNVPRSHRALEAWLRVYPGSFDAAVLFGSLLRKQKRYTEAETVVTSALRTWPGNATLLLEAALVRLGLNDAQRATALLSPVLQSGERQRERYLYLSNALLDMGKWEESEAYFAKASALFTNQYEQFRRAKKYALMGEKSKAFEYLNRAVALGHTSKPEYERDADLQSLKTDARWKALVEKLK